MKPGQLNQHARLMRERYADDVSPDGEAARAWADLLEAQANLIAIEEEIPQSISEENCTITDIYPIIGEVARRGGEIITIEYPWEQQHVDAARTRGIDMAWEWCHDPRAGISQGELIRIYIGTRDAGPRAMWSHTTGMWTTHASKGNYGNNWACGGNWSSIDSITGATLEEVAPDLHKIIQEVRDMNKTTKIEQCKARIRAAELRIRACSQRDYAMAARRQAEHSAYQGQGEICLGKAEQGEAHAAKTEAEADLVLAEAGL